MAITAKEETKTKVSRIKVKKKQWYKIIAPTLLGQREIGESYLASPDTAMGRVLDINLKDLTSNVRDQNAYVRFRVTNIQGQMLHTEIVGYSLTTAYIKRLVRKSTNRIDGHYSFVTNNGKRIILKTLMITLCKVHRSIQSQLQRQLGEALQEEIVKNDFETFFGNLVSGRISQGTRKRLTKIYPLKELALRFVGMKKEGMATVAPEQKEMPVPAESELAQSAAGEQAES